jgi:CRISPR-associated protein Cas5d
VYCNVSKSYNSHTPLAQLFGSSSARNIKGDNNYQLLATVLVDVCYRFFAVPRPKPSNYHQHGRGEQQEQGTTNGAHAYKDMFERRLKKGKCCSTPFLGWKEFTPTYWGPIRSETSVVKGLNLAIPSMLRTCFPSGKDSDWMPVYEQNVMIKRGVLEYAQ